MEPELHEISDIHMHCSTIVGRINSESRRKFKCDAYKPCQINKIVLAFWLKNTGL